MEGPLQRRLFQRQFIVFALTVQCVEGPFQRRQGQKHVRPRKETQNMNGGYEPHHKLVSASFAPSTAGTGLVARRWSCNPHVRWKKQGHHCRLVVVSVVVVSQSSSPYSPSHRHLIAVFVVAVVIDSPSLPSPSSRCLRRRIRRHRFRRRRRHRMAVAVAVFAVIASPSYS